CGSFSLSRPRQLHQQVFNLGKYNETCHNIVPKYISEWEAMVTRTRRWIDFKNDYKTMDLNFMESLPMEALELRCWMKRILVIWLVPPSRWPLQLEWAGDDDEGRSLLFFVNLYYFLRLHVDVHRSNILASEENVSTSVRRRQYEARHPARREGHLHTNRVCDNVWTLILTDATFKSVEIQETLSKVNLLSPLSFVLKRMKVSLGQSCSLAVAMDKLVWFLMLGIYFLYIVLHYMTKLATSSFKLVQQNTFLTL
ncbi:hypothetical protein ACJX0J_042457, partial [Zea mays]